MAKEISSAGSFSINIDDSGSVKCYIDGKLCDNTKDGLRKVSDLIGFNYEKKWTTQQFGNKLTDYFIAQYGNTESAKPEVPAGGKKKYVFYRDQLKTFVRVSQRFAMDITDFYDEDYDSDSDYDMVENYIQYYHRNGELNEASDPEYIFDWEDWKETTPDYEWSDREGVLPSDDPVCPDDGRPTVKIYLAEDEEEPVWDNTKECPIAEDKVNTYEEKIVHTEKDVTVDLSDGCELKRALVGYDRNAIRKLTVTGALGSADMLYAKDALKDLEEITFPDEAASIYRFDIKDKTIYCKTATPPDHEEISVWAEYAEVSEICVPSDSLTTYRVAEEWEDYRSKLAGYDFSKNKITTPAGEGLIDAAEVTVNVEEGSSLREALGAYNLGSIRRLKVTGKPDWGDSDYIGEDLDYIKKKLVDLEELTDPDGRITILKNIFGDQTDIVIPEGVTVIGKSAFEDLRGEKYGIKSVTLPKSLRTIEERAFNGCDKMEKITIPEGVECIGNNAFTYSGLKEITFPASLTELGRAVLCWCDELTTIYFKSPEPPRIPGKDRMVFEDDNLKKVYVPIDSLDEYSETFNKVFWWDPDWVEGYDFDE